MADQYRSGHGTFRLLLDEHYSTVIASELRRSGHDALGVAEVGLAVAGAGDEEVLRFATSRRRTLLTNNVRHFAPLAQRWAAGGEEHLGLLFTSDASMPQSKTTIGVYLTALRTLMHEHPDPDSLRNQVSWL